jgi:hypothetical protein
MKGVLLVTKRLSLFLNTYKKSFSFEREAFCYSAFVTYAFPAAAIKFNAEPATNQPI